MKGKLNRDVTMKECYWIDKDYSKGTSLTLFTGPTFGCVSSYGKAVLLEENDFFLEIPCDAIDWE